MSMSTLHSKRRFNPHITWALFCSVFIIALIVILLASSWYFIDINRQLDAPIQPVFAGNASKIQEMQQALDIVEKVVEKRTAQ